MAVASQVPVEEYLSTSWDPDREYVDGRLIERNVGELDHSYLQGIIYSALQKRGLFAFVELRVQVRENRFRIPDVLALRGTRPANRFLRQPPYIVVEILSREDRASDIADKIDDYLDLGIQNIWVVDPRRRRVAVHKREGAAICRDRVETLDGSISIALGELFEDMPLIADDE